MAERGPPVPKLPTAHKPAKTKATDQARANDTPEENPPLEPEVVVVPPDQVPHPAPSNLQDPPALVPPAHILDPAQPQNSPARARSNAATESSSACT